MNVVVDSVKVGLLRAVVVEG